MSITDNAISQFRNIDFATHKLFTLIVKRLDLVFNWWYFMSYIWACEYVSQSGKWRKWAFELLLLLGQSVSFDLWLLYIRTNEITNFFLTHFCNCLPAIYQPALKQISLLVCPFLLSRNIGFKWDNIFLLELRVCCGYLTLIGFYMCELLRRGKALCTLQVCVFTYARNKLGLPEFHFI